MDRDPDLARVSAELARYKGLLVLTHDPQTLRILFELIAEAEAKLAKLEKPRS
jgi:hypothetical protein